MTAKNATSREIARDVAATCPAMRARALSRRLARRFDDALRPHGLNSGQFAVLVAVEALARARVMDVADALALSRAAATRSLDILERNGWVRSEERNATTRLVGLTDAGRALLVDAYPSWRQAVADVDGAPS
ncbi:MAG: MarR family transcriptional regulator [Pseudomonadota bacterium]